jgi:hypothetical protein
MRTYLRVIDIGKQGDSSVGRGGDGKNCSEACCSRRLRGRGADESTNQCAHSEDCSSGHPLSSIDDLVAGMKEEEKGAPEPNTGQ